MRIIVHSVTKRPEQGQFDLSVSFGDHPPKNYRASYDASDPKFKVGCCEQELFFKLSELAHARFGNCAIYQMELMGIIAAVYRGDTVVQFPIELGTTSFGSIPRPGRLGIAWNKFRGLLYRIRHHRTRSSPTFRPSPP